MMEENITTEKRKWGVVTLFKLIIGSFLAIVRGEFILKLKVDKYLLDIAYTFFLFAMVILFSMLVDNTLAKVERNNNLLKELNVEYTEKTYELVKLNRRSTVNDMLKKKGSKVGEREKEVIVLK